MPYVKGAKDDVLTAEISLKSHANDVYLCTGYRSRISVGHVFFVVFFLIVFLSIRSTKKCS